MLNNEAKKDLDAAQAIRRVGNAERETRTRGDPAKEIGAKSFARPLTERGGSKNRQRAARNLAATRANPSSCW